MHSVLEVIRIIADVFTIAASALALWVYFTHRDELSAALRLFLNFSYQTTLGELRGKLDRLNEYNANEPTDIPEIRNILHEIAGQMKGNRKIAAVASGLISRIEQMAAGKRVTEPARRSLVSESREVLRTLNVDSIEDIVGR
jgi:hypothetical protein